MNALRTPWQRGENFINAFSRRFIYLTVFLRRLLGAVTALISLARSFHLPRPVVFFMKIDEKICKF